jgi:hypothetical protein
LINYKRELAKIIQNLYPFSKSPLWHGPPPISLPRLGITRLMKKQRKENTHPRIPSRHVSFGSRWNYWKCVKLLYIIQIFWAFLLAIRQHIG